MYEADELCQRIAVIADGDSCAPGTPAELKARVVDRTVIEIETFGVDETTCSHRLRDRPRRRVGDNRDRGTRPSSSSSSRAVGAELVQALLRELDGTTVGKVITREPTLEDAYVELV